MKGIIWKETVRESIETLQKPYKERTIVTCPECIIKMTYRYSEYSIELHTCPRCGRRAYVNTSTVM